MYEEYHTLTVHFPNKSEPIYITNVPYDATCSLLAAKFKSLPIVNEYEGDIVIKCNDEVVPGNTVIDEDEIYIEFSVKRKEKILTKIFFTIFFFAVHISPFIVYFLFGMKIMITLCTYLGLLFLMGLFILILHPDPHLFNFNDTSKKNENAKRSKFHDCFILFLKSFLPSFRLEQITAND